MSETTEIVDGGGSGSGSFRSGPAVQPALVVVAWPALPERVGEVVLAPDEAPAIFGREASVLVRQRPERNVATDPPADRRLSRRHLRIQAMGRRVQIERLGRAALLHRGRPVAQAVVQPGDLVAIEGVALFWCTLRPKVLPGPALPDHPWGRADAHGIVGEAPATWALRQALAFVGPRAGHGLILGPSGAGKELAAGALHRLSPRAEGPYIARNAATLPASLMDAELFGHARDYPNTGAPARPGLVGAAEKGTLFLDEIGELSEALQAHLLRLMDAGEYQRLGDPSPRRADLRLLAATHRDPAQLKADLRARFRHEIHLPPLADRRADVPLLARHLVALAAHEDAELAERFCAEGDPDRPRLSLALIEALMQHPLPLQVRALDGLLWRSLAVSSGPEILPAPALQQEAEPPTPARDPTSITPEAIQAALAAANGVKEDAWRALGLASRYQLRRLMQKYGLE